MLLYTLGVRPRLTSICNMCDLFLIMISTRFTLLALLKLSQVQEVVPMVGKQEHYSHRSTTRQHCFELRGSHSNPITVFSITASSITTSSSICI